MSLIWKQLLLTSTRRNVGCPLYPIRNRLPNWWSFMIDRDDLSRLSVRNKSAIEFLPPHLYECLWHHYFRTRNIVIFFFFFLFVLFVCCCDPSWTVTPFDDLLPIRCIGHSWKKCVEKSNANARHLTWIVYWGCIIPSYNIINILANFNYTVSNN